MSLFDDPAIDPYFRDNDEDDLTRIRQFSDVVHGMITFGPLPCSVIDTKQFQRLRYIKQLGTTPYVWPTASHTRFEHCLGVGFLAKTMVEHLRTAQPKLNITDSEVDCVTIAGLCHDLGHGPWSHVWDGMFIPQALPGSSWKHEDASEMMFDALVAENKIALDEKQQSLIKALIAGEPARCEHPASRNFLFEIVANKRNGLDVDKFDYIARDTYSINKSSNLSLARLINSARVIENQICYDIKDANQVYELCYTRFSLHKSVYNHKVAKAIEYMIIDALLAAEPHLKIAEQIYDPKRFLHLTDAIMPMIEASLSPELETARQIFGRIAVRDLYKMVDANIIPWDKKALCKRVITPESIVNAVKFMNLDSSMDELVKDLKPEHVIVDYSSLHYGMHEKNPLDFVKFYSKRKPNVCMSAGPGDITLLLPSAFAEGNLKVFVKDHRFFGLVQAGYRKVLETLNNPDTDVSLPETPNLPTRSLLASNVPVASTSNILTADDPGLNPMSLSLSDDEDEGNSGSSDSVKGGHTSNVNDKGKGKHKEEEIITNDASTSNPSPSLHTSSATASLTPTLPSSLNLPTKLFPTSSRHPATSSSRFRTLGQRSASGPVFNTYLTPEQKQNSYQFSANNFTSVPVEYRHEKKVVGKRFQKDEGEDASTSRGSAGGSGSGSAGGSSSLM
ncbi:hypothetical protein ABKN59_008642 [Abortiporus biennis]